MACADDKTGPVIGSIYNGSKVVDIKVEVSDGGTRIRRRSTIYLENGIIMTTDHFKDKKFEEVDAPRRRAPGRTKSGDKDLLPVRGLPTTQSGRHLPKPMKPTKKVAHPMRGDSPARGQGRARSSSRGRDVIIRAPPGRSKSSDLEEMNHSNSSLNPRAPRLPPSSSRGHREDDFDDVLHMSPEQTKKPSSMKYLISPARDRDLSPEPEKKPSSLRSLSNFLTSPKRQAPGYTKSGNDLEALRNSLHSCTSKASKSHKDDEERKPRTMKLGSLIGKKKNGRSRSGSEDHSVTEGESVSEELRRERRAGRKKEPTAESNKEKLKSFKEMIATSHKSDGKRRHSSTQEATPCRGTPSHAREEQSLSPPEREPSLSPVHVKKPASSSYITGFLDKLYDSYMKDDDDDGEGSDDDDDKGYGRKSTSLLDMSLNKFVEWAE
jgi:hypothetical protein